MNKIKNIFKKIKSILKKTITLLFYFCPIQKNKITFCNFAGKGYGCNPKYLAEEFLKDRKYKLIWFVSNINDTSIPSEIKKIKYGSLKHYYHLITAKLWIDNIRNNPKPLFKRRNQTYIQTWHGGGYTIKGIEKDVEEFLSKDYIKNAKKDSKLADYFLSNCKYQTEMFRNSFWYNGEILEFGTPKFDCLVEIDEKKITLLKEKYNIGNKKIILYAPSFRNDKTFYNSLEFDVTRLINTINKKFNEEFLMCIKLHPNDDTLSKINTFKDAIDLTQENDSHLILSMCDIVISDYSTMGIDFTLTNKPVFIYAPDYDYYISKERKLYIDLENYKLPFAKDFNKLIYNIENFNNENYLNNIKSIKDDYQICDNIKSSKKIKKYLQKNGKI